jgi:hypothetical protein
MFALVSETKQKFLRDESVGWRMGAMLCTRVAAHDYGGEGL